MWGKSGFFQSPRIYLAIFVEGKLCTAERQSYSVHCLGLCEATVRMISHELLGGHGHSTVGVVLEPKSVTVMQTLQRSRCNRFTMADAAIRVMTMRLFGLSALGPEQQHCFNIDGRRAV
jgi:hypothetical protein